MKKTKLLFIVTLVALLVLVTGCRRNAALPVVEEVRPEPQRPQPAQVWEEPDTTAFVPVIDLDAEIKRNLQTVFFALDRYDLSPQTIQKLQTAAAFLNQHQQIRVRLDGHADERGTTEYNLALGERRARAVFDALVRFGVDRNRMETTSFGREKPVRRNCNGNEECHSANRRVEFTVIRR